jgi:hypothetical protein
VAAETKSTAGHKSVLSGCGGKEAKALLRRRDEAYSCLQLSVIQILVKLIGDIVVTGKIAG